ncbi:MAG: hypothetical protein AAFX99_20005 [Myxococcota bacterium]
MSTHLNTTLLAVLASLLMMAAVGCGDSGDDGSSDTSDSNGLLGGASNSTTPAESNSTTPTESNSTTPTESNSTTPTTGVSNTTTGGPGEYDYNGFTIEFETAQITPYGMVWYAVNSADFPYDRIEMQMYQGEPYFGPTEPGSYDLNGINYRDCGLCIVMRQGCDGQNPCQKVFYAEQGTVDITAIGEVGDRFTATLNQVVLDEVTIDGQTFVSTKVADGETWLIDGLGFDQEIQAEPTFEADCESDEFTCVGETVNDFSLQNCGTGEMTSLSEMLADGDKALWVVLTAGWCPACRQWLPQVVEADDANPDLEVVYILGQDANYAQPTLSYCEQYAEHYTDDIGRFFIDHDGQQSFATTFANMWFYLDPSGAFGLPWNAIVAPDTMEFIYADGEGSGSLNEAIDSLLVEE